MEGNITITKKEYLKLLKIEEVMSRLEAGGVDNWEWYGESIHSDDVQDLDEWIKETTERLKKHEI